MLIAKFVSLNLTFLLAAFLMLPASPIYFSLTAMCLLTLAVMYAKRAYKQQQNMLLMITEGMRSLQDGDFSVSLPTTNNDQQNELISLFNQATDKLRVERQSLYQRELLLDKVVNASDVVTVLVNHRQTIIFANRAASRFFASNDLLGQSWTQLLENKQPALQSYEQAFNAIIQLSEQINSGSTPANSDSSKQQFIESSWHLSRHQLRLHGAGHQLILLKPMTQELHKQELQTWKKVISVINHELNNSIAPISSMCHSGKILADRLDEPNLNRVFETIAGRIKKLSEFIQNYSQLARLSKPNKAPLDLVDVITQIGQLYPLTLIPAETTPKSTADAKPYHFNGDRSQLEQLLINLLKNAKEAGSEQPPEVRLQRLDNNNDIEIVVRDFGSGMSHEVMQKSFLPYYSTKTEGSGIGLSICREVVDSHDGKVQLSNHPEGGLQVTILLPNKI